MAQSHVLLLIWQTTQRQITQSVQNRSLQRRIYVRLARRADDGHARIATTRVHHVCFRRQRRAPTRFHVRLSCISFVSRENPFVVRRVHAVVDGRVVDVQRYICW